MTKNPSDSLPKKKILCYQNEFPFFVSIITYDASKSRYKKRSCMVFFYYSVGEIRQPRVIFQFPFFFGQVDNKESKTRIVVSQYNSLALF